MVCAKEPFTEEIPFKRCYWLGSSHKQPLLLVLERQENKRVFPADAIKLPGEVLPLAEKSEQVMDKLTSESAEKSRYTYSTYKWRLFNTIFHLSRLFIPLHPHGHILHFIYRITYNLTHIRKS